MISVSSVRGNLAPFGGNQYRMPNESKNLQLYFTIQIFFSKAGSLIGRFLIPILRKDLNCFGQPECYPLAFGLPAFTLLIGTSIFAVARNFYTHKKPSGNMLLKVITCLFEKLKSGNFESAKIKFGVQLVNDTKTVLKVLKIFITIPIFWAVYGQQSSSWIFQANRMNLDLGFYTLKPDQLIALNPVFVIILLPVSFDPDFC